MGTMLNGGHSILLVIANGKSLDWFLQTAFVIVGATKNAVGLIKFANQCIENRHEAATM